MKGVFLLSIYTQHLVREVKCQAAHAHTGPPLTTTRDMPEGQTHTLTRTHKTHHQIIHTFRLHYPPSKTRTPNGWKPTLNRSHDHATTFRTATGCPYRTEVCMTEKRILVVWEKTLTSMIRKEKTHFQALLQISDTSWGMTTKQHLWDSIW